MGILGNEDDGRKKIAANHEGLDWFLAVAQQIQPVELLTP